MKVREVIFLFVLIIPFGVLTLMSVCDIMCHSKVVIEFTNHSIKSSDGKLTVYINGVNETSPDNLKEDTLYMVVIDRECKAPPLCRMICPSCCLPFIDYQVKCNVVVYSCWILDDGDIIIIFAMCNNSESPKECVQKFYDGYREIVEKNKLPRWIYIRLFQWI